MAAMAGGMVGGYGYGGVYQGGYGDGPGNLDMAIAMAGNMNVMNTCWKGTAERSGPDSKALCCSALPSVWPKEGEYFAWRKEKVETCLFGVS